MQARLTMAWISSGKSNVELAKNLRKNGIIKNPRVFEAMASIDRAFYSRNNPYQDSPQRIGYSATISAPHMHAYALELLEDKLVEGARVLDVGSGSGYLLSCFAHMVGESGIAVGIEHISELVDLSISNINNDPVALLFMEEGRLEVNVGDGREGYPPKAPYDVIHVGAAASSIPPALVEQLNEGGRMVLPVGPEGDSQIFTQLDKKADGSIKKKEIIGVLYVPLTSKENQTKRSSIFKK